MRRIVCVQSMRYSHVNAVPDDMQVAPLDGSEHAPVCVLSQQQHFYYYFGAHEKCYKNGESDVMKN